MGMTANVNRGKGKKGRSPDDFNPYAEKPRPKQYTEDEILAFFSGWKK